jgi:hypothetical protein
MLDFFMKTESAHPYEILTVECFIFIFKPWQSDPRGARMNRKKRFLMAFKPIDLQDEDPRFFRPNPVHICPHVVQAYNIALKSHKKKKSLEESLAG